MKEIQISFCVALKDRSAVELESGIVLNLFPNCIESLSVSQREAGLPVEVVVADFGSSDEEVARRALDASGLPYKWVSLDGGFCRGRGLNAAAAIAGSPTIFFLDADMLVSAQLLRRITALVREGVAYFPWCMSYRDSDHSAAWERREGWGMCGITRDDYRRVGKVVERGEWGHEDIYFREKLEAAGVEIAREQGEGLLHQWHPNGRAWKNRFSRGRAGEAKRCILELYGEHPRWNDVLHLFDDGRFSRTNGDGGNYCLVGGESLTLNWDRWGSEPVTWDEGLGLYVSVGGGFRLRPVVRKGCS